VAPRFFWTTEEDELLKHHIDLVGPRGWSSHFTNLIPGRTAKQCRERWFNHLSGSVVKGTWTAEEDRLILAMVEEWGTKWSRICKALPPGAGRTDNAVKNRWNSLMRRQVRGELRKQHKGAPEPAPVQVAAVAPVEYPTTDTAADDASSAGVEPAAAAADGADGAWPRRPGKASNQATALASLIQKELAERDKREDKAATKAAAKAATDGDRKRKAEPPAAVVEAPSVSGKRARKGAA